MAKNALGKGLDALLQESNISSEENTESSNGLHAFNEKKSSLPSCIEVDENGGLWINPELLKPNPKQPRTEFNQKQLDELCESVIENGILQPIIIEQIDGKENEFYIIAGERRTRAAKMAGLPKVPVQLRKFDDEQKLQLALIENIQRADLNPIEEATAYYNLIQMSGLSQDEIAKRVGKNRATVANSIRLLKLPDDIQKALMSGQITAGHAKALLMIKNDSDMRIAFGKIIGSGLSVRETEAFADLYNNGGRAVSNKKKKNPVQKDPDIDNFEQEIKNLFGVKEVNFKGTIDKGSLEIKFASKSDFERIYEILVPKK